jgi:uncharacterized membrane protein (DUF2068 family)
MESRATLLPWIVAFKALKAALLITTGVALLASSRKDPVELVIRLASAFHVPFTSRTVDRALDLAFRSTPREQVGLAFTAFAYAALMTTEGIGLYLRKHWARWFTIIATGSFIPLEMYEIVREPRPLRIVILVLNVGVVVYLFRRKEIFEG